MRFFQKFIFIVPFLLLAIFITPPIYAATVKTAESVYLPETEKKLDNAYLFGSTVTTEANITNDLVTAGRDVTVNGDVTGSLMAAGEDLVIRSRVGNSVRVAGANVTMSGKVTHDVIIAAGVARITKTASISGDVYFFGSELVVEGSVAGKVVANGEQVIINATVGSVEGTIGSLIIGEKAVIQKDLRYTSANKAEIHKNAKIIGEQHFQQKEHQKKEPTGILLAFMPASLYGLVLDIILSVAFVLFFPTLTKRLIEIASTSALSSAGKGFFFLIFWPLLSLLMLLFLWLAFASFLLYGLVLVVSIFLAKIVLGWWILTWWYGRKQSEGKVYSIEWKAAVIGSITIYILLFIPVLGWIIPAFAYLISVGAIVKSLFSYIRLPSLSNKKS